MNYDAVLFDAAGTLFTTRGSVGEIYGSVARRFGSTAPASLIQAAFVKYFRQSGPLKTEDEKQWWKDIVWQVFSEVGRVNDFDRFFEEVYEKFRDSKGWIPFPETLEVLQTLKQRGLKLGIISNFDSRLYGVLESLGLRTFFDSVTISSETGFAKPHPQIFRRAIRDLDVPVERILLVGDSLVDDVEAGQAAGLQAVLLDRSDSYPRTGSVAEIRDLRAVLDLVN